MEVAEARIGGEDIHAPTSIRKVALASFIGSTVEWYDFFVYGTAAALVFALSYATEQLGIPSSTMLTAILVTAAIGFITKPIYGALSDRIGRRPIYAAGSIIGALVAFPFYLALESRSVILIFLAYLVAINIAHNLNDSVESSFFSELFGSRVRYSGAALGHQLGGALTGFTPLIAAALAAVGGWTYVAAYAVLACLVSAACVFLAPETFQRDIAAVDPMEREIIAEPMVQ
jgi:MHS family shikimate/dehydroshikimate transporter-like MFS transporter